MLNIEPKKLIYCSFLSIFTFFFAICSLFAGDYQDYLKSGDRSPKWTPLIESGFSALESGNDDIAVNFLERAIEKGCNDGLVYFKLALYYEGNEKLVVAKKYFELAETNLPKRYPHNEATLTIHEHLGRVLYSMGDIDGAKKELSISYIKESPNFSVPFLLGSIARQEGDNQKVIEYYSKALQYAPPPELLQDQVIITILVEIGMAYYALKEYDKSLEVWNQILAVYPSHPIAKDYKSKLDRRSFGTGMKENESEIFKELFQ